MFSVPADSSASTLPTTGDLLWWPEVHPTVSIIALVLGFLLLLIAYFAGARDNRNKIIFSVISSVLIGILSLPIFIKFGHFLGILTHPYGQVAVLVVVIIFVAMVSSHAYEIVTVSAREARPPE
ncbi:hypothetical protein JW992_02995 [candidate division KSB1 bacterium]|nr:hypothetical protein [candidate division KSB1 bacterium]